MVGMYLITRLYTYILLAFMGLILGIMWLTHHFNNLLDWAFQKLVKATERLEND